MKESLKTYLFRYNGADSYYFFKAFQCRLMTQWYKIIKANLWGTKTTWAKSAWVRSKTHKRVGNFHAHQVMVYIKLLQFLHWHLIGIRNLKFLRVIQNKNQECIFDGVCSLFWDPISNRLQVLSSHSYNTFKGNSGFLHQLLFPDILRSLILFC